MTINICGYGFVGGALGYTLDKNKLKYNVYDTIEKKGEFEYHNNLTNLVKLNEELDETNFYFLSVPTPSDSEGNCDTSIVRKVLLELNENSTKETFVCIKSTVIPGTTRKFQEEFPKLKIVFTPEFLLERRANEDMYNADFVMYGISENFDTNKLTKVFDKIYSHKTVDHIIRKYEEAELFKYSLNNYLAVKVWYFNKIYDLCEKVNVDYQSFRTLFPLDSRFGEYGTHVPYIHGRGFSGACLVKENKGMIKLLEELNLDNSVFKDIRDENKRMRNEG